MTVQTGNAFLFSDGESVKSGHNPNQRECYLFFVTGGFLSVTVISSNPPSPSCLTGGQHYPQDNSINHKNYNDVLNCDWFKKNSYFPLIHLPSCYRTACYRTVCYRTVQQTNQIQSCSLSQPITIKVVV